jgi:hypothetical protein
MAERDRDGVLLVWDFTDQAIVFVDPTRSHVETFFRPVDGYRYFLEASL